VRSRGVPHRKGPVNVPRTFRDGTTTAPSPVGPPGTEGQGWVESPTGQFLMGFFEPWMTDSLALFLNAVGTMFDPLMATIQDQGIDGIDADYVPGYGSLFDIDRCPPASLPYLGQFVGVRVPTGMSATDARQLIKAEAGINRGTPASIMSAVQRFLTGSKTVVLQERLNGQTGAADAYQLTIGMLSGEVGSLDQIKAAVNAVKPAGIVVTYQVIAGWTHNTSIHAHDVDTFSHNAALTTQP
jgi:hypothetical protein